jgi:hypothetical protein
MYRRYLNFRRLDYRGQGLFMISRPTVNKYRKWFKARNL